MAPRYDIDGSDERFFGGLAEESLVITCTGASGKDDARLTTGIENRRHGWLARTERAKGSLCG